jgi:hypothetical protein
LLLIKYIIIIMKSKRASLMFASFCAYKCKKSKVCWWVPKVLFHIVCYDCDRLQQSTLSRKSAWRFHKKNNSDDLSVVYFSNQHRVICVIITKSHFVRLYILQCRVCTYIVMFSNSLLIYVKNERKSIFHQLIMLRMCNYETGCINRLFFL